MSEVIVAGGGPAGLAAAIAARQAGLEVTLFDCARPPIDKACGEGIMPDGLKALSELGVEVPPERAFAFRGIRFVDDSHTVEATFGEGEGYGVRRVILHELLVRRAAALGVKLCWGTHVSEFSGDGLEVESHTEPFRWLVCADGQNSLLRRKSGMFSSRPARQRYGFRRHYRMSPWTNFVEVHWADCGQMYVTPVAEDEVCVALITGDPGLRFDVALPVFSKLAPRLQGAEIHGKTIGAITASRRLKNVQSGRIALIGEAAGSVDAITGEGLSISFQQALQLASAMQANRLKDYERAHQRIMRMPRTMSRLLLAMDRRHSFRSRALGALERQDEAFQRMLALHTGSSLAREFDLRQAIRLGWNLIHA
jgi:flavin-dependent dehydrogenase